MERTRKDMDTNVYGTLWDTKILLSEILEDQTTAYHIDQTQVSNLLSRIKQVMDDMDKEECSSCARGSDNGNS